MKMRRVTFLFLYSERPLVSAIVPGYPAKLKDKKDGQMGAWILSMALNC